MTKKKKQNTKKLVMGPYKHFPCAIHQTSIRNYGMRKKEAPAYYVISKEIKNHIFRSNWIFRHAFCINNPHWQNGGIIIFVYKYFIVISDKLVGTFLGVLFLLLAVILLGLLEKPRRNKDWVTEKVLRKICVSEITFLKAGLPFYVTFYCFLCLLPPPFQVMYLLNSLYKDS